MSSKAPTPPPIGAMKPEPPPVPPRRMLSLTPMDQELIGLETARLRKIEEAVRGVVKIDHHWTCDTAIVKDNPCSCDYERLCLALEPWT